MRSVEHEQDLAQRYQYTLYVVVQANGCKHGRGGPAQGFIIDVAIIRAFQTKAKPIGITGFGQQGFGALGVIGRAG